MAELNLALKDVITPLNTTRGAPMGRSEYGVIDDETKYRLAYVPFVDNCYDTGGAYWGSPANLWALWDSEPNSYNEPAVVRFVRANDRRKAWEILCEQEGVNILLKVGYK